jgi:hypothetical protein
MHTQTEFDFIQQPPSQSLFVFSTTSPQLLNIKPNYNISFHHEGKTIGYLDWNDGDMKFSGSADESAKIFFDSLIKR